MFCTQNLFKLMTFGPATMFFPEIINHHGYFCQLFAKSITLVEAFLKMYLFKAPLAEESHFSNSFYYFFVIVFRTSFLILFIYSF
jgi:hypothetical protein